MKGAWTPNGGLDISFIRKSINQEHSFSFFGAILTVTKTNKKKDAIEINLQYFFDNLFLNYIIF